MFENFFISHLGSQYVNVDWSVLSKLMIFSEHFQHELVIFQKEPSQIFFSKGMNRKLNQNQLHRLANPWGLP